MANSFDLWQKDAFFSAAEEVQRSADLAESVYRTWLSARREGLELRHLNELYRELHMALGTAKWQLEEFERAVRLSYTNNGDDTTVARHRQFVSAVEDQISHVETAAKELLNMEGKNPFRWVNLDEEECHDLAVFLSGMPGTSQRTEADAIKLEDKGSRSLDKSNTEEDFDHIPEVGSTVQTTNHGKGLEVPASTEDDVNGFMKLQGIKYPASGEEITHQADQITSDRRAWSLPDQMDLEIVIDSDNRHKNSIDEATPKEKGYKPFLGKLRGENCADGVMRHAQLKISNWINQHPRGGHRSQRQWQMSPVNSIRYMLAIMLTIFLVVPFLMYST